MNKTTDSTKTMSSSSENSPTKNKPKTRGKKRRRFPSDSSENEGILPDNTLEMEKKLYDSAIKNNLDDISVRKILKKVVTNDHVLALVKLREEEDSGTEENSLRPKLTRAKVKELKKVSPRNTAWNLENLELTPIKHIPVKTRPEVKALIAQELPDDEDDEEYEPTHDDVPSDDDHCLESCSDLDSQPRTPATPSQHSASPMVVKDGPFKVPQDVSTPTRRKLELEEDATIALRTRSKLSLSATSIEHIESTFIPPDDIPPAVDDLWNQFLNECLNPASVSRTEEDDEADPEYNVAADPDAHDEDEEGLGNSIIKISKKELNDLVTELFNIMPAAADDELMANNLANSVLTDTSQTEVSTRWEGKVEPLSDEETRDNISDRITFENKRYTKLLSVGKRELEDTVGIVQGSNEHIQNNNNTQEIPVPTAPADDVSKEANIQKQIEGSKESSGPISLNMEIEESTESISSRAPSLLQQLVLKPAARECVRIQIEPEACQMLPEQLLILQQQLRQHIQLAAGNFLQLYIHPTHWKFGPNYKEYLESLLKIGEANTKSVVNVCNLVPAVELIREWETSLAAVTPENAAMMEFLQKQDERSRRAGQNKHSCPGLFHPRLQSVVAHSSVFLYPRLLPPLPYRADHTRRFSYLRSEDELIALGLDQFWQYVENNPALYACRPAPHARHRAGVGLTVRLVCTHMFAWLTPKTLLGHIQHMKKLGDKDNPIVKFFKNREITPVKHRLLPFDPTLTLYQQSEHEMPKVWVRYLGQTSQRFKQHRYRRSIIPTTKEPGVPITINIEQPTKTPLHQDFTKEIICNRQNALKNAQEDIETEVTTKPCMNMYELVETSNGAFLMPITTVTVTCNTKPITTSQIKETNEHCTCCILLRKISKRQTVIEEYFTKKKRICECRSKTYPRITNRLKLLASQFRNNYVYWLESIQAKLAWLRENKYCIKGKSEMYSNIDYNLDDLVAVTQFHLRLLTKMSVIRDTSAKKKVHTLLSRFKPSSHDPVELARKLHAACGVELLGMYKELLGFLTPEQADTLGEFRDYFVSHCVTDLVDRVEQQVPDLITRKKILDCLQSVCSKNLATACEICTSILTTVQKYPKLAEYVFSLFPHRKHSNAIPPPTNAPTINTQPIICIVPAEPQVPGAQQTQGDVEMDTQTVETNSQDVEMQEPTEQANKSVDDTHATVDYEADHSTNDGGDSDSSSSTDQEEAVDPVVDIKTEEPQTEPAPTVPSTQPNFNTVITISKTEIHECDDGSNHSLVMMFDDDDDDDLIKPESPEWRRDEDKVILQLLKDHLTPEQRQDKTISEIIDEKTLIDLTAQSLTEKSVDDIRKRIMYLLQLLVLSEV